MAKVTYTNDFNAVNLVFAILLGPVVSIGGSAKAFAQDQPKPKNEAASIDKFIKSSEETPKYTWTLDQVKQIAFDNNPDLKSARANYDAASKEVGVAVSAYLPHVDLNAKYEETTLPSPSAGATSQLGNSLPYKNITATLNQTIFDFGKALSRISSRRAASNASEQDAIAVRNAVELAVQRAFYDVESAAQLVEVSKKGLIKFNETFRRTEVLVRTGAKPNFDLTQAKVEVAKAKLAVINAQNTHDFARISLLNLMGIPEQPPFALLDKGVPAEDAAILFARLKLPHLIDRALQSRPEMKRQEFFLDAAKFNLSGEIRNYLPSIGLEAWAGKFLPDYPVALRDAWGVGVVATWHVFQGLETTFRVGELAARVDSQEALVEKDKLSILAEVTRGYRDLGRSENNLEVAEDALESSKENLYLAQKRYDANVATILELLTAEGSLLSAEATAVTARYDHAIAVATLRRVVNAPLTD
jgi:outer membrane protein